MSHLKLGLSLVFAGIVVIFVAQNVAVVEIRFLFWTFVLSRVLLIFCVLAIGIIIGWMLCSWFSCRRKPVEELANSER
jgi:uncharacterized integral membrane protein